MCSVATIGRVVLPMMGKVSLYDDVGDDDDYTMVKCCGTMLEMLAYAGLGTLEVSVACKPALLE